MLNPEASAQLPLRDKNRAVILGVSDRGIASLTEEHVAIIAQADVVIGSSRLLALCASAMKPDAHTYDVTGRITEVPNEIEAALTHNRSVVVLATGDPLCHGIANYLKKKIGLSKLEIIPNVSALQLACARAGVSWQDAYICSVHGKDAGEWMENSGKEHGLYPLLKACVQHRKTIAFTSPENNPARIARMLVAENMADDVDMVVAENLLQDHERIITGVAVRDLATQRFSDVNMVILERKAKQTKPTLFGVDDTNFEQRKPEKGLITKREVRAVSLAMMQLKANSIVWDIGAGSGSVGLEAARLCANGWVYAIEKNETDHAIAKKNQWRMGIHHYTLINNTAPLGMEDWAAPDAVFIGGSGGKLDELIRLVLSRLNDGGHLVMNFVTLENLATATATLKSVAASWQVTQMQVSRSKPILHMHRMAAENPVWIVTAAKGVEHG